MIWDKFPAYVARGDGLTDDFMIFMADRAMFRQANPLNLTMALKKRQAMNRGKMQGYTSHRAQRDDFQDTLPVASHPDYGAALRENALRNVPTPPPPPGRASSVDARGRARTPTRIPFNAYGTSSSSSGKGSGKGKSEAPWKRFMH